MGGRVREGRRESVCIESAWEGGRVCGSARSGGRVSVE